MRAHTEGGNTIMKEQKAFCLLPSLQMELTTFLIISLDH